MATVAARLGVFNEEDHKAALIFDPDEDHANNETHEQQSSRSQRPVKRRRVSKKAAGADAAASEAVSYFVPLLNGAETASCVKLREELFQRSWSDVESRIQAVLKIANSATLDQVGTFFEDAQTSCVDQIPAAFITTGPNIASQDLLFEQLSETLQQSKTSRFVRLRSSEALTLKATLKKIIRDVTASTSESENDEMQVGPGKGSRRYLDYDLEALHSFTKTEKCQHVFIAVQDSEGFDSALLSDLVQLLNSWRPQVPFSLLFGVATSIELLQTRILKSACRLIYGAQFDVVQTETILESVFKSVVSSPQFPLQIGPSLLASMLDRQQNHIAGIQAFVSSLKYAYMTHFYSNALSIFMSPAASEEEVLQAEHLQAMRNLPSFRHCVEREVEIGVAANLQRVKSLIEDDNALLEAAQDAAHTRQRWVSHALRSLLILVASGAWTGAFSRLYVQAMRDGLSLESSGLGECIRRRSMNDLVGIIRRVTSVFQDGDASVGLEPSTTSEDVQLTDTLLKRATELESLVAKSDSEGFTLRSKYSGQSKVMRTTVIAQRVQLSRDSAALRDEDKQATEIVDDVVNLLGPHMQLERISDVLLSECWLYNSRSPSRDIFVPRPRLTFQRSLSHPHDYLNCSCCSSENGGMQATMPATSILHSLYLETGSLANVADMWSAYLAVVGEKEEDQRKVLFSFYRGLAELRALGFIKGTRRKTDHMAKVKWL